MLEAIVIELVALHVWYMDVTSQHEAKIALTHPSCHASAADVGRFQQSWAAAHMRATSIP